MVGSIAVGARARDTILLQLVGRTKNSYVRIDVLAAGRIGSSPCRLCLEESGGDHVDHGVDRTPWSAACK